MQKKINEKFYLMIQREVKSLVLNCYKMSYENLIKELELIIDKVIWSDWGLHGNLTKKALLEYLDILYKQTRKQNKSFKFLGCYLFNDEVDKYRKLLRERYKIDFKE